jgi:signal transduction histidine kinase
MSEAEPIILYVDDERANRVVFEHAFKTRFPIRCVPSGEEALLVMRDQGVAVLVTDQRMPGMSGHELLEQTRTLYPDVVRIVITAYGDVDPILRAVNDGLVARYLVKPWDRAELEQILAWGLEAHALARRDSALQLRLMETERLVTIGSIGAAVLHDLQQPISSVRINLERVRAVADIIRSTVPSLPPEQSASINTALGELPDLLEDLNLATDVMHGIVEHLRSFLHPKPASSPAQTFTDPLPIVRYAISVCREIAQRVGGQINYDGTGTLPRVKMGSTELTQVLINLMSNASNAIGHQGRVLVAANVVEGGLRFVIADNGAGMPVEVLQKAGTPFFTTREKGTGLGRSQCHRLLGIAGARLELESAVGTGTIARFTLPVA